jgi:hypothetical protein
VKLLFIVLSIFIGLSSMASPRDRFGARHGYGPRYERSLDYVGALNLLTQECERMSRVDYIAEYYRRGIRAILSTSSTSPYENSGQSPYLWSEVNMYGKYSEGGGCNMYGCYDNGGNCNMYGCYQAGGQCNMYGCTREADKSQRTCFEQ